MEKSNVHHFCQGQNSHYFHITGARLINPIVGVYIPLIRIPTKGGMNIPNIGSLDPGTRDSKLVHHFFLQ